MRLSSIKLVGFKSFVDPTTLHLPTNMTAVVGPNGCGKSNIIDAIRWVMGESAASRLRGEALSDVIFSGSSARQPVGSATVELLFDNSSGAVTGEYAAYAEISVKRSASRDGQSQYYLNGTRCRRRDITGLFLGTGLGPRSYSIIEQGMISQIIEADPEQLRMHLEEAAGISRYRERRRETESRIRATRDNLERVHDVCDEVGKQLERLQRQARAAERWQQYRDEQARKAVDLKALQLRAARQQLDGSRSLVRKAEVEIDRQLAGQRQLEVQLLQAREAHGEANEALNASQARVYEVGGDIARVEQQIQHHAQLTEQLGHARDEARRSHEQLERHLQEDATRMQDLRAVLAEAEPRLEQLRAGDDGMAERNRLAEEALAAWQHTWERHAGDESALRQSVEVENTRLDYLRRQQRDSAQRSEALRSELAAVDLAALQAAADELVAEHDRFEAQATGITAVLATHRARLEELLASERDTQASISSLRGELEAARGRLGSLEALQHAALADQDQPVRDWLQRLGLDAQHRLGEVLRVEEGWERAVETVLSGWLEAMVVEAPQRFAAQFAELEQSDLALIDGQTEEKDQVESHLLAAKVQGNAVVRGLLRDVHMADSLAQAQDMLATLPMHASVITSAGEWLAAGFTRIRRGQGAHVGVLAREREIKLLRTRVADQQKRLAEQDDKLQQVRQQRVEAERQRDEAQRGLHVANRGIAESAGQLQSQQGRLASARERMQQVNASLAELEQRMQAEQQQLADAQLRLEQARSALGALEKAGEQLRAQRTQLIAARDQARHLARDNNAQAQQLALTVQEQRTTLAALEQTMERMQAQRTQLHQREQALRDQLADADAPVRALQAEREQHLERRVELDAHLSKARAALEQAATSVRTLESQHQQADRGLVDAREQLSQLRLATQEHELRAAALGEAITQAGFDLQSTLRALPDDADPDAWQQELDALAGKIQRLEPVNLAAIQEFEQQQERKSYLDAQMADLHTALESLEEAMRKIDSETRQRFRSTFEQVNTGVEELFPRLFGGGHAHLELTSDDLLTTGVSIVARPPGKRVSSISLLSGGEKAMTAVALVFAIFRLNPAPFCLLDEVDAPLDESNVTRFTDLVKEMSEQVQFVFVTHNKTTMEAAAQLCGVTMREPGVSRLVQVDLAEAAQLAGVA